MTGDYYYFNDLDDFDDLNVMWNVPLELVFTGKCAQTARSKERQEAAQGNRERGELEPPNFFVRDTSKIVPASLVWPR